MFYKKPEVYNMGSLKHLIKIDSFDEKIYEVFKDIIGVENEEIIKDFLEFYQLKAELIGDILHISMFFTYKKAFLKVAEHNLETGETKTVIPKDKLLLMIIKENENLLKEAERNINRSAYIILSIIALISGGLFGYILFKIVDNF